jgi:hypothetical protein
LKVPYRTLDTNKKKATAEAEEEVGWDEDSDDEAPKTSKPKSVPGRPASTESSTTLHPTQDSAFLKPDEKRKSHDEKSQADSDASYDVVGAASGAPSHAPGSPKSRKGDDSEEEDWE